MTNRVHIVGVGADGRPSLTARAAALIDRADLLVGGERLLALFPESHAERLVLARGLDAALARIQAYLGNRRVVVLASGDPGFFGIARVLARRFGKEWIEIVPNVSSIQLAFARIKESWEEATFLSAHGRTTEGLIAMVRRGSKVAILTDEVNTPAVIARSLLAAGVDGYRAYLCENLGATDERVRDVDLGGLTRLETSPLSVLILLREGGEKDVAATGGAGQGWPKASGAWPHGIPDEEFFQPRYSESLGTHGGQGRSYRGLITKVEVRLASLARLGLSESSIVWDVGSGTGSVAIEAAMIARLGQVYAVERSAERVALIHQNLAKFGTRNVLVIQDIAPAALEGLPGPDAVFVGGSGGQLSGILDVVSRRLNAGGRVVVNAATLETAGVAMAGLRERDFATEVTLMQVSRGRELGGLTHLEALDPVFVIAARRNRSGAEVGW